LLTANVPGTFRAPQIVAFFHLPLMLRPTAFTAQIRDAPAQSIRHRASRFELVAQGVRKLPLELQ